MHQLVSFQIGGEEFAFPMRTWRLQKFLREQTPKEVPGAPAAPAGAFDGAGKDSSDRRSPPTSATDLVRGASPYRSVPCGQQRIPSVLARRRFRGRQGVRSCR